MTTRCLPATAEGFHGRGLGVTECPAMRNSPNFARLGTSWAARLGQQTRRDEPHGQNIVSPRDGDGEWLVRAISWLRGFE